MVQQKNKMVHLIKLTGWPHGATTPQASEGMGHRHIGQSVVALLSVIRYYYWAGTSICALINNIA